jgi:hypothetical protein
MLLDATLVLSQNQAITVTAPSSGTIDFASLGLNQAVTNRFGTGTNFGEDPGIGDGVSPPNILCVVGTTFTAGGAGTLTVQLQESVDTSNTGVPASWKTIAQTDALALAQLTAGQQIAEFTIPPRAPTQGFPRFFRLNYVVGTGPMTAGTIAFAGIITGRDDAPMYPAAY